MTTVLPGRHHMKNILLAVFLCVSALTSVAAPTPVSPIFINAQPLTPPEIPPQLDAVVFWNQSLFVVSNDFLIPPFAFISEPYEGQSVQFWTNNGTMLGLPGFRLNYTPNPDHLTRRERRKRGATLPRPSQVVYNDGEITVADSLQIHARNLYNPGLLAGDVRARIRINVTNGLADLSRGAIHVGDLPLPFCSSPTNFVSGPFFFSFGDPTVRYDYLSSGVSGSVGTNRFPLPIDQLTLGTNFFPNFLPPFPRPPFSEFRQFIGTNLFTNILTTVNSCGEFDAFVFTRTNIIALTPALFLTNREVSVVFVPTNGFSTNVSVRIGFPTNDSPIVEFRAPYFDVIGQRHETDIVTFRDDGASIFRGHDCQLDNVPGPNTPFNTGLFYSTNYVTNLVDYFYTVASAQVGTTNSIYFTNSVNTFTFFPALGQSLAAASPTNFTGSVHIRAHDLDLTQARIRAENGVFIQATNLVGNANSFIDAPFITFDVGTTNNTLTISNLALPQVNRVQANFNSWAGSWNVDEITGFQTNLVPVPGTNLFTTNIVPVLSDVSYHVLILGACVDALHPSILEQLSLHGTNIVIEDNLAINRSFQLEGRSVTFGSNSSLSLPLNLDLAFTNVIGVTSLTNEGVLNVPDAAYFGMFEAGYVQPPRPRRRLGRRRVSPPQLLTYENFVNHDTIRAASVAVRAGYVEHAGPPFSPALILATNGSATLDGGTLLISNAVITARSDIRLTGGDVLITHSILSAGATNFGRFNSFVPGALIIDPTNSFTDGGLAAANEWRVTSGVRLLHYPAFPGDLMGTRIVSVAGTFNSSRHVWSAQDRGVSVEGFSDNLAVGHFVLDGALGTSFRFSSATTSNAIYIDYLELLNFPTNYNFALSIDPDFTIYFANAYIPPEKLDQVSGGRLRWVSEFTGPLSSTNILYPDNHFYTFNIGLVRSKDLDSDGDGIVNADDCTPIAVPGIDTSLPCPSPASVAQSLAISTQDIGLTIGLASGGEDVVLNWNAPANSANTVEFSDSLAAGTWQPLTNFINGPVDTRVTVRQAAVHPLRVYRVHMNTGPK